MSEFVAIAFKQADKADQVLNKLRQLDREYLIDLEDAVVAVRGADGQGAAEAERQHGSMGARP